MMHYSPLYGAWKDLCLFHTRIHKECIYDKHSQKNKNIPQIYPSDFQEVYPQILNLGHYKKTQLRRRNGDLWEGVPFTRRNEQTNKQKIPELRLIIWAANERWLLDRWSGKIWGREHRRRCPICILGSQLQQAITNFFSKWQKVKDFCSHRCISVSLKPPCFLLFFFPLPGKNLLFDFFK